jgi:hypothetical protein
MRYVVLHHTGWVEQPDHYDLMLQLEEGRADDEPVLKTLSTLSDEFPTGVSHAGHAGGPTAQINLLRLISNHRRAYLTFQGPLARNRGNVERVDEGNLMSFEQLAGGAELRVQLAGRRLNGEFRLRHLGQGIYCFEASGG